VDRRRATEICFEWQQFVLLVRTSYIEQGILIRCLSRNIIIHQWLDAIAVENLTPGRPRHRRLTMDFRNAAF
jgi:hypothetical protein